MSELIDCIDGLTAEDIIKSIAKTANGQPFYLQTVGAGGFVAQYQAVYDALTTKPSDAVAAAQNTMVAGLVADGVWAKLDIFHLFAQTTNGASESLVNWIAPGTNDATLWNNPPFVALEGFTSNGTTMRINSPYNPTIHGVNYTQNSASIGCYIRTNVAEDKTEFGVVGGGNANVYMRSRSAANQTTIRINDNQAQSSANTDSRGMWVLTRTASNVRTVYRNKAVVRTDAIVSVGLPNATFQFLALSGFGEYSTKQQSVEFLGGGFTQTDVNNMTDRIETYMDSNGKGVIP